MAIERADQQPHLAVAVDAAEALLALESRGGGPEATSFVIRGGNTGGGGTGQRVRFWGSVQARSTITGNVVGYAVLKVEPGKKFPHLGERGFGTVVAVGALAPDRGRDRRLSRRITSALTLVRGGNMRSGNACLRALSVAALILALTACQPGAATKTSAELAAESLDRGIQAQNSGKTAEAVTAYFETLAKEPQNKFAFYNLGQIYRLQNKVAIAEGYYRQALEVDPEYPPALFGFGFARLAVGAWQEAHDANVKVIAAEPNNAAAHFNLALALRGLGKEQEAQQEFARAVQIDRALVPPPSPAPTRSASPSPR